MEDGDIVLGCRGHDPQLLHEQLFFHGIVNLGTLDQKPGSDNLRRVSPVGQPDVRPVVGGARAEVNLKSDKRQCQLY